MLIFFTYNKILQTMQNNFLCIFCMYYTIMAFIERDTTNRCIIILVLIQLFME